MDIFVYGVFDNEIILRGVTDEVESFKWKRCFFGSDEFEMLFPLTEKNRCVVTEGSIIEVKGRYSGIITRLNIFERDRVYYIKAEGCSLDGLLKRRVLVDYSSDDSFMTVLDRNCGEKAGAIRRFPSLMIDVACDCYTELAEAYRYKSLMAFTKAVGRLNDIGVMAELYHDCHRHYIRLYCRKPTDRTVSQNKNRRAVFSDRYDSFYDAEYVYSDNNAMTGAVVYSESKHLYNSYIDQWCGVFGEDSSGFDRYEKSYRIQPKITYIEKIVGEETALVPVIDKEKTSGYAEYVHMSNYSEAEDNMIISFVPVEDYTEHFDVGDRVTVECSRFGRLFDSNICTITERYIHGGFSAEAEIGKV